MPAERALAKLRTGLPSGATELVPVQLVNESRAPDKAVPVYAQKLPVLHDPTARDEMPSVRVRMTVPSFQLISPSPVWVPPGYSARTWSTRSCKGSPAALAGIGESTANAVRATAARIRGDLVHCGGSLCSIPRRCTR